MPTEIPRKKWPKLGVFLPPPILKKLAKRTKQAGVRSMTRYVEALVVRDVETDSEQQKAS